jgi:hypothetical protein
MSEICAKTLGMLDAGGNGGTGGNDSAAGNGGMGGNGGRPTSEARGEQGEEHK